MMEANWCDLPGDVVVEILSRLPVKSLLRFRSVSKDWLNMLSSSNPGSVKCLHSLRANQNPYLIVWNDNKRSRKPWYIYEDSFFKLFVVDLFEEKIHNKLKFRLPGTIFGMVQFCHGLVCFFNFGCNYVFNPSTQEFVKLPEYQSEKHELGLFGIGFLPLKNEYKVVAWTPLRLKDIDPLCPSSDSEDEDGVPIGRGCQILTLTDGGNAELGTWRVLRHRPRFPLERFSLCVNGVLYWLSRSRWVQIQTENPIWWGEDTEFTWALFSFDLEKEEWQLSSCPNFQYTSFVCNMVELEGCLCVGDFFEDTSILNLWMLKNNNWEMKCSVQISSDFPAPTSLVAYISKGADDEELIFMTDNKGLLYYNIVSDRFRRPQSLSPFVKNGNEIPSRCFDTLFRLGGA